MVLEELLEGEEVSVIALCDGERYVLLPPAQDHKRVGEGDTGPNTGGMGAYAPAPFLSDAQLSEVGEQVIAPTLATLRRRGIPFRGALYAGLMLTRSGPKVLEFNARFGDPETQVLMMQLGGGRAAAAGRVCARHGWSRARSRCTPAPRWAWCSPPRATRRRRGGAIASRASTRCRRAARCSPRAWRRRAGRGSRPVAGCSPCARAGADLAEARSQAYAATAHIRFEGMHFRRDIGAKGLRAPVAK